MSHSNTAHYLAALQEKVGIDFSKYRSEENAELVVKAVEDISPWGIAGTILGRAALLLLIFAAVLAGLAFYLGTESRFFISASLIALLLFPFALISSIIRRLIIKLGRNGEAVTALAFDTSLHIISDLRQFSASDAPVPLPADIVRGAIYLSILPSLSFVLKKRLSFFAVPAFWVIDRTVVSAAEFVLKKVEKSEAYGEYTRSSYSDSRFAGLADGAAKSAQALFRSEKLQKSAEIIADIQPKIQQLFFSSLIPKLLIPLNIFRAVLVLISLMSILTVTVLAHFFS